MKIYKYIECPYCGNETDAWLKQKSAEWQYHIIECDHCHNVFIYSLDLKGNSTAVTYVMEVAKMLREASVEIVNAGYSAMYQQQREDDGVRGSTAFLE